MHGTETLIPAQRVASLVWEGDTLFDRLGGSNRYSLDGKTISPSIIPGYAYPFNAVTTSPSGKYEMIYAILETKGLLLNNGKVIREINRSYYCASRYEYPISLLRLPDGREALVHCPDRYCRLEIEDIETGERLTASNTRKPMDFFHSRLKTSPDGRYLLSAGWIWHPVDAVRVYDVASALNDPTHLDGEGLLALIDWENECNAAFLEDNRLIVALATEEEEQPSQKEFRLFDLTKPKEHIFIQKRTTEVGTMMPVGKDHLLGLYKYPKLFDIHTGEVVQEWPYIMSGNQLSSIRSKSDAVPPIALDPVGKRCAIAGEKGITVLVFEE